MPRELIFEIIDWKKIVNEGKEYGEWLAGAASPARKEFMEKRRKGIALEPQAETQMKHLSRDVHVVAIAEDWCVDVQRNVPVLQRLADLSPHLKMRFIMREQFPDVFIRFLTNGGEAIPKFIFLNDEFVECGNWGPMPERCKELIARGKASGKPDEAREKVAEHYSNDPDGKDVAREIVKLIAVASCEKP